MKPSKTIYHFGLSGGKDSTALLLWACYESGIPLDQIRVTFCNTGNESPITLQQIWMLHIFVHPIEVINPPLDFYALANKKKRFPSSRVRFCTQELKMKPTQEWISARWNEGYEVILYTGVRASESEERSKLAPESFDDYYACVVRRPLLGWTIGDVWAIHDKYSVPKNPLYEMGFSRVGCFPCVMERKKGIRILSERFPERIDFIRRVESDPENNRPSGKEFFAFDKTPENGRSTEIVGRDGSLLKVARIDDVVRWSRTVRGGKQYALGTIEEDAFEPEDDKTISCPSAIGQCE